jgi:myo-inositol-hexaphosphate 3-phosphohydrolase
VLCVAYCHSAAQNFKLVSWTDIVAALSLP